MTSPAGWPVVGMVGGGQLARMTHPAAIALGVRLAVLAASPDESAAQVIPRPVVADEKALADLMAFAADCDVVTFDHEHVPPEHLRAMEAAGVVVRPRSAALLHAQDKGVMRARLSAVGVPCPRHRAVADADGVSAFAAEVGWPVVLKRIRGGYDGRGVWVARSADDVTEPLRSGAPVLAEELVDFRRELSAVVARSPSGQGVAYPVVESVQRDGMCVEVVAPAPGLSADMAVEAQRIALMIAAELEVEGVLAVELFETVDGRLLVNELAMRPHNSGHWGIDGAVTSQFENHLRAVLDLPLGSPAPRAPFTVMVNILGGDLPGAYSAYRHVLARDPDLRVHWYGKSVRPGRKVGHVTVCGDDLDDLRDRARHAAAFLRGDIDE
ncbi:MAG TPA: 5-(carboxyamino)imidazole ribonucleotide synthase [Jiangellaceae bacterium]